MGTRGLLGFVIAGKRYCSFNSHDSYPEGLGQDIVDFLLSLSEEDMQTMAANLKKIEWVINGSEPEIKMANPLPEILSGKRTRMPSDGSEWWGWEWAYYLDFEKRVLEIEGYTAVDIPFAELDNKSMDGVSRKWFEEEEADLKARAQARAGKEEEEWDEDEDEDEDVVSGKEWEDEVSDEDETELAESDKPKPVESLDSATGKVKKEASKERGENSVLDKVEEKAESKAEDKVEDKAEGCSKDITTKDKGKTKATGGIALLSPDDFDQLLVDIVKDMEEQLGRR